MTVVFVAGEAGCVVGAGTVLQHIKVQTAGLRLQFWWCCSSKSTVTYCRHCSSSPLPDCSR